MWKVGGNARYAPQHKTPAARDPQGPPPTEVRAKIPAPPTQLLSKAVLLTNHGDDERR